MNAKTKKGLMVGLAIFGGLVVLGAMMPNEEQGQDQALDADQDVEEPEPLGQGVDSSESSDSTGDRSGSAATTLEPEPPSDDYLATTGDLLLDFGSTMTVAADAAERGDAQTVIEARNEVRDMKQEVDSLQPPATLEQYHEHVLAGLDKAEDALTMTYDCMVNPCPDWKMEYIQTLAAESEQEFLDAQAELNEFG